MSGKTHIKVQHECSFLDVGFTKKNYPMDSAIHPIPDYQKNSLKHYYYQENIARVKSSEDSDKKRVSQIYVVSLFVVHIIAVLPAHAVFFQMRRYMMFVVLL